MRIRVIRQVLAGLLWALPGLMYAPAAWSEASNGPATFPYTVEFQLGEAEFLPGDSVTIQRVTGTSATIGVGETYCVEGSYTLGSRDKADLALFATTASKVATRTDPSQIMRVEKGSGTFRLVKTMREEGYLHVSLYPAPSGSAFGGVYFGQGKWVLHHKGWSYADPQDRSPDYTTTGASAEESVFLKGPNITLFKFLGDPVEPPADMDPAYTKEGLIKAVQTAARKAGVSVKRVEIEDSEFPFLVGIITKEGEWTKVTEEFRKMPPYAYNGSHSTPTHCVFNLVPYPAYPRQVSERVGHRTGLRCQVFLDKLLAME